VRAQTKRKTFKKSGGVKMIYVIKPILVLTILGLLIGTATAASNFGGIASNISNPPPGTQINADLTNYYHTTTATGNGTTYWYIAGFWYTQEEMLNLPSVSVQYGESPYALPSGGSKGRNVNSVIHVPISNYVIIGFIGVVLVVACKRSRM
jgi:hypothetical protein